jgi:hypothetical protein
MGIASFQPPVTTPVKGTSLAEMMGMAQSAQALQQAKQLNPLQIEQAQLGLKKSTAELQTAEAAAKVAKELTEPHIFKGIAESETAGNTATLKRMELAQTQATKIHNGQISLLNNPLVVKAELDPRSVNPDDLVKLAKENAKMQAKNAGIDDPFRIAELSQPYIEMAKNDPGQFRAFLKQQHIAGLDAAAKQTALTPSGIAVNTGAGGYVANTNPFAQQGQGQQIPGTGYTQQLPPTTPVISPTGQPGYLGPQDQKKFVASALPPGASLGTEDWASTYKDAQNAQQRIGLLQNIKDLAGKAFVGVGGSRKEFVAGLANSIGIPAYELEKANTDVLAKNSNLLALAGGNTDLARQLAEAANPNKKMNYDAIKEASNQLIGVEKLKAKKADLLAPYANDPVTYQQKALEFNRVADARLLQEMSPEQIKSLKKSMSEAERKEFSQKIQEAKKIGLIQ